MIAINSKKTVHLLFRRLLFVAGMVFIVMSSAFSTAQGSREPEDESFLNEAILHSRMQIQLAMLAGRRAESESVKSLADNMLKYHNELNDRLKQVARENKFRVKDELDDKCKDVIDKLSRFKGGLFEKRYINLSEEYNRKSLAIYQSAAARAGNAKVQALAASVIPFLETHDASLRLLDRSIKETSKL